MTETLTAIYSSGPRPDSGDRERKEYTEPNELLSDATLKNTKNYDDLWTAAESVVALLPCKLLNLGVSCNATLPLCKYFQ